MRFRQLLGLGMVAETILEEEAPVSSVTVVKALEEVIDLVGPHLEALYPDRLTIVAADAFEWVPSPATRYSIAWHDIWTSPFDPRGVAESCELMARYAPHADWQGSWVLEYRSLAGLGEGPDSTAS